MPVVSATGTLTRTFGLSGQRWKAVVFSFSSCLLITFLLKLLSRLDPYEEYMGDLTLLHPCLAKFAKLVLQLHPEVPIQTHHASVTLSSDRLPFASGRRGVHQDFEGEEVTFASPSPEVQMAQLVEAPRRAQ